jgi:WD40 repeat protein/tetratricopeptide (TPR) repeat protein
MAPIIHPGSPLVPGDPEPEPSGSVRPEQPMPSWNDIGVRARAGLFFDVLQLVPSDLKLVGEDSAAEFRRRIAKKISRLESQHPSDQALLESLVPMREWLQGRLPDYLEWVLPCLDYFFLTMAGQHGADVLVALVNARFFDFTGFQKCFLENEPSLRDEPVPESLEFVKEHLLSGPDTIRELDIIEILLGAGASAACRLGIPFSRELGRLFGFAMPDEDYLYVDGQGFCETDARRHARERALRLLDRCPDDKDHHRRLGLALLALGEPANAMVSFQRELRQASDAADVHINIACCQMRLDRLDEAKVNAETALAGDSTRSEIHHDFAAILLHRGEIEEAYRVASNAMATLAEPALQLRYLHALLLARVGKSEAAITAWNDYLNRARREPGHRKAVARAVAALRALGQPYLLSRFPIRLFARQAIEETNDRMKQLRDGLVQSDLPLNRLHVLESDRVTRGWQDMDAVNQHCQGLTEKSESVLTASELLDSTQMRGFFNQMREELKRRGDSYYSVLRGGVQPLLQQIMTRLAPHRDNLRRQLKQLQGHLGFGLGGIQGFSPVLHKSIQFNNELAGHLAMMTSQLNSISAIERQLAAVDRVVQLGAWMVCRESIKHLGVTSSDGLVQLLRSWQERPANSEPSIRLAIAEIVQSLRECLTADSSQEIVSADGILTLSQIHVVLQKCEAQVAAADLAIDRTRGDYEEYEKTMREEETRFRAMQEEAERQAAAWSTFQNKSEAVARETREVETELTYCAGLRRATGFWAALTGRSERVRQISAHVSNVARQVAEIVSDMPPFPRPPRHLQDSLIQLQDVIPRWLKNVQAVLAARDERAAPELERCRAATKQADEAILKCRQNLTQKKQQVSEEQSLQAKRRFQASNMRDALARFQEQVPAYGFFPCRDVCALAALQDDCEGENVGCDGAPRSPPNGRFCFGSLKDGRILVRSANLTGSQEAQGSADGVTSLTTVPSKALIASASTDGHVRLWSVEPLALCHSLCVGSPVYSLTVGGDWLFAGMDGKITVFALSDLGIATTLTGIEGMVFGLAWDQQRRRLYGVGADFDEPFCSAIYIWDASPSGPSFRLCQRLRGFEGAALCVALDPSGTRLAAGEGIGTVQAPEASQILVWDANTLRLKNCLTTHEGWVETLAFSPDGRWLVSGDAVGPITQPSPSRLLLHDLETNRAALTLQAHAGWVRSLAFGAKGRLLFSGGSDGTWVWDFERIRDQSKVSGPVAGVAPRKPVPDEPAKKRLIASVCAPALLEDDMNLDSLRRYVASRLSDVPKAPDEYLAQSVLQALDPLRYRKIRDIDAAFSRGFPAVQRDLDSDTSQGRYRHAGEYVCVAIAFSDKEYRDRVTWSDKAQEAFRRFAAEIRVDPYDSCPCGSGKKYKFCCAAKQSRDS